MDNILFIVPPYVEYNSFINPGIYERSVKKDSGNYGSIITDMPIGLISLSAYLKLNADVKVKLIDFNILLNKIKNFEYSSFSELFKDILSQNEWQDFSPSIIGISTLFTTSFFNMLDLASSCKEIFPNALIIGGGGVPTNMAEEIFESNSCFDALCYGEGEKPLLGLVKSDDRTKYFDEHPSWITKEKIKNKHVFRYDYIEDLDEIPTYDYSILETEQYALNPAVGLIAPSKDHNVVFHVMTTRGCPYHCCFCASHTVHGRKMRYHSIERIKKDLVYLQDHYGADRIVFQDDHLMGDKERAFKIIDVIKELNISVFFQNGLAIYALDREMLEAIKSIGIKLLLLSIESGSERVLREIIHKPSNLAMVHRVVNDCRQLGIEIESNILIGLPGETKQDIEDSREFLKSIDINWYKIFVATPLIGSDMFDVCLEHNYLNGSHIGSDYKKAVIETEDFTPEYIQEKVYLLNLELNFVHNSDFKLGLYEAALIRFEKVIKIRNDHAFAFYYAAQCCKKLNIEDKYENYKLRYLDLLEKSDFWQNYSKQFNLEPLG